MSKRAFAVAQTRRRIIDATRALHTEQGIAATVDWYLEHQEWVDGVLDGSYRLERIGTAA